MKKLNKILTVNLGSDFILLKFVLFLIISIFGFSLMLILNEFDIYFIIILRVYFINIFKINLLLNLHHHNTSYEE